MNYTNPPLLSTDPAGTDLMIDSSGDLILSPQGDVSLITGDYNILQAINTRLRTIADTYIFGNDLGSALSNMVDEPDTDDNIALIKKYTSNSLLADPRIQNINTLEVYSPDDGSGMLYITLNLMTITGNQIITTVPVGSVVNV